MNWGDWTPQENILLSILEVLQEAMVPDNEIQKNVQQKLNLIQNINDFTYYLLFIISNPNYSEEIRSLSGILLKNNINSVYDSISQDYLLRIRQECLRLLQDPCKDIRMSISNVLVMLAKDNLSSWPELVPFLINSFDAHNEFSEIALNTLFKICEELIRNNKTDEEIYGITRKVFPKLNEMLSQEKCNFNHDIIRLVNQFLQEYFMIVKQSLDLSSYLRNIMKYADSEDVEMQKQVSMTFDLYLDNREDSLLPHLHEIILYLLAKTQHKDSEVALQACEFWFTATKLSNCKELLTPYMEKLLPVLLKNMKYSDYELMALKDCLGNDSNEKDLSKDIYRYQNKEAGDEECYSDEEDNFNEEVDDCYIGWTLRKCSAASLDGIAVRFREDLLPLLVPYLNEILSHQDYYIKESAILALGAVAEGCMMGLKPYLPFLVNYLINSMNDEHSVIRVITCWTLGRYVPWIISSDPSPHAYFIPVMTVLLKHFIDDNKRVQRAAISAFCIFQETAQAKLIPYIDIILEGFDQGFQRFQYRSLYLLYDAIGALAQSVGNQLSKPEYINKLMPQLMQKFSLCDSYSDDNFIAVLECLSNIIPALEISFLPYSEVVYWHCLRIITDTIHSTINYNENPREHDIPDKEPMNVAHDVLYSMALGLKNHFIKYVMNSNLLCLLHTTMMENMSLIRQTAIALYGELIILCFPYLSSTVNEYIPILIKNLDEKHEGVCNNAAWALGKLSSVMGSSIQPFIPDMLVPLVSILRTTNLNRPMFRTVALSFCIICYVSNDLTVPDLDFILKNCCMLIRNVKDSEEKDLAFRGLCKSVVSHPSFFKENFMYFCDAVASWNSLRLDLKEDIKSILASFKEQCGEENWNVFYQQCPEPLKLRLITLKCPWHLISFISRIVIEKTRKRCKKQPVQCGFNPSENAYDPLKLMHTVIEVINEVCFNFKSSLNVQNVAVSNTLPTPEDIYCVVSMSSLKNSRRKMEDRSIVVHDLNTIFTKQDATPSHYYAVFDGHDGEHAAVYCANHLHQYLAESTNFTSNPEEAIKDAFCKTDCMFVNKCETDKINSGTTAVCSLLLPKEKTLYVAWVGDSQAALISEGEVLPCVVPHKPDREDERKRIENDGGMVLFWGCWRVNGQLSVSRAIGDPEYKPYVTAIPEIVKIPLGGKEDFLILASDGLWDHVSFTETANVVYDAVRAKPGDAQTVSRDLVQLAKQYGSGDNISVIVVFLRDPHQIAAAPKWNTRLASMDTLDNANNPFAIPNKTSSIDRIAAQTEDGLLLDFGEELKKNDEIPNNDLIKMLEKSNCGLLTPDFDKEDNLGPETNVDNPDDDDQPASPNFDTMKRDSSEALNNNQNQNYNPFSDIEKSLELNLNLKAGTFEGMTSPTEEECVPPANSVHNVSQLIDAGAESDSEEDEEWNYVSGEEANKENNKSLKLSSQVAEEEAEDIEDAMSQLNPNAAEFIPSPPRAAASPLAKLLVEDQVISRSPKKPPPTEVDINVPNECDFERDISQKPREIEESFSNGHQDANGSETSAINAFNSRLDEFHFGPNAAPFTPSKLLDQSECSSTRANFGDESELTLGNSFNDSVSSQDQNDFVQKDDPMSMSFHQDRSDDLFDLNKVHMLPEDVDEFIKKGDSNTNSLLDGTISDLTEHYPLGNPEEKLVDQEFITDLDQEDNNVDNLQTNQSSTPIDERSLSPLDIKMKVEDNQAPSPREETNTPLDESSHASSIEECKLPEVEHSSEQHKEQRILESPYEQNRIVSPFEDENLSSPSTEQKHPLEVKEMYSTLEEKDVCSPDEEKDVCVLIEKHKKEKEFGYKDFIYEDSDEEQDSVPEKEVIEEKDTSNEKETAVPEVLSPVIGIPDSSRNAISLDVTENSEILQEASNDLVDEPKEILSCEFVPRKEENTESLIPEPIASPLQENQPASTLQHGNVACQETVEQDITSPALDDVVIDSTCQEGSPLVRETAESPSLEQEVSTAEIVEDNVSKVESIGELADESVDVTTNCDNLESPKREIDAVVTQTIEKDEQLLDLQIEKSDEDKAKENAENSSLLDISNTGVSKQEDHSIIAAGSINTSEFSKSELLCDVSANSETQINQSQSSQLEIESTSLVSVEHETSSILNAETSLNIPQSSPAKELLPDLSEVSSSLIPSDVELVKIADVKSATDVGSPKPKEADKKPATKARVTPSSATKKPSATAAKVTAATSKPPSKPSPKQATKPAPKTNPTTSRGNLTSKTETTVSRVASKTATSTTSRTVTATNRIPLSSRSTSSAVATKTNGTTRPATKPSTGAIKKTTDVGSSARTVTSTTQNKTSSTARPATTTARSTTAAAAPRPRPNTLKPALSKPADAPKPATTRSVTAPRVPLSSRTTTAKTSSSLLANKEVKEKDPPGKSLFKPRSVTDKQVKDTANKLTAASRAVSKVTSTHSVSKTTTVAKKAETTTGTKTTSRTTTTTSRAPIRKPTDVTKAATTKVSKPKQNGVAAVVEEKIIVNEASKETNGDEQFIKDISPVDNKLITDLSKSAAN